MNQIRSKLMDAIGRNCRKPEATILGRLVKKVGLEKKNGFIEIEAVRLSDIHPDHQVLEIGFGPGIGIEAAYNIIKGGKGKVYGVDFSEEMVLSTTKRLGKGLGNGKVKLINGDVENMSFLQSNTFDRVFHCNCYYFWPDMTKAMNELHRVMKPGAIMVTAMNYERVMRLNSTGFFKKYGNPNQDRYLSALESCGFDGVELKKFKHGSTGANLEAIIAKKSEK
ncbi:demethylmenaquinone methyltransferase-like isoform X2 [Pecten maximus]|uniref:demethylmenaquinone methyltransferase-like isoform X1 n=1 Tax=Pecten maximus TaxID=6579 RepID=UPI0014588639|nr:demethylmenaquinone methyltransferase-like isoform X1 [Pecten maximus]XP_033728650.1 demethylmenaquinone methyltransferase-like isoform X2 [Pecten maximus]